MGEATAHVNWQDVVMWAIGAVALPLIWSASRALLQMRGDLRELVTLAKATSREVRSLRKAKHILSNRVHGLIGHKDLHAAAIKRHEARGVDHEERLGSVELTVAQFEVLRDESAKDREQLNDRVDVLERGGFHLHRRRDDEVPQ